MAGIDKNDADKVDKQEEQKKREKSLPPRTPQPSSVTTPRGSTGALTPSTLRLASPSFASVAPFLPPQVSTPQPININWKVLPHNPPTTTPPPPPQILPRPKSSTIARNKELAIARLANSQQRLKRAIETAADNSNRMNTEAANDASSSYSDSSSSESSSSESSSESSSSRSSSSMSSSSSDDYQGSEKASDAELSMGVNGESNPDVMDLDSVRFLCRSIAAFNSQSPSSSPILISGSSSGG